MGRYLSLPILGFAAALSSSILPQIIGFFIALLGDLVPFLENTRGQLSLVMLLVMAWSIRSDLEGSFAWALVGGIAMDLLSIIPVGVSSIALLLIVCFAVHLWMMKAHDRSDKEKGGRDDEQD